MARGENPGVVLSIQTALTYNENLPYGHAQAGKDLCLAVDGGIAAGDEVILGKFLELHKDRKASYLATGTPMILRQGATAVSVGDRLLGAGDGKVKGSTTAQARGLVIEILETGDNGRIKVLMPA